jgi:hypothetical protein
MWIFARLLIAHLLSDIPLNLFASEKRNGSLFYRFLVLGLHTTIVFLTTLLLFVDKLNQTVLACVLLVAGAHFLIDALRLSIEKRVYNELRQRLPYSKRRDLLRLFRFVKDPGASWSEVGFRKWFLLNVLDQCLHLVVLVLVAGYLGRVL